MSKQDQSQVGILFQDELKRIGLSQRDFAKMVGLAPSGLTHRIYHSEFFKLKDIISFGAVIAANGGNPENIWPNYKDLVSGVNSKTINELQGEKPQLLQLITGGHYLFENRIQGRPSRSITVPGFEDLSCWLRTYDNAVSPKYLPGTIFGLKEIKDPINALLGGLFYFETSEFDTFRIIKPGKRPDTVSLIPINPDLSDQEFYLTSILKLYEVKGFIQHI